MEKRPLCTAAAIAKDRLEQYLSEKLKDTWDECAWELYTYLLEQAKNHRLDTSGYAPPAYQKDHAEAMNNRRLSSPDNFISDKKSKEKK